MMDSPAVEEHAELYDPSETGEKDPAGEEAAEAGLEHGQQEQVGGQGQEQEVEAGGAGGATLHVAAVATHKERYFPLLVESSKKMGVRLQVLGWGEPLTGFAFRLQKTLDFVETLPQSDVVLFVDAFDVVLLQSSEVILAKFHQSGAQMIVSKDGQHPNHLVQFFMSRVFRPVGGTYINIGAYVGTAGFICDLLRELFKFGEGFSDKENDQELLARYLASHKELVGGKILIDHNSDLFLNLYGGRAWWVGSNEYRLADHRKDVEITEDGALHYLKTDAWPCVLHGPANTDLKEVLDRLGYKLPAEVDKDYTALTHTRYLVRMFRHYWKFVYQMAVQFVLAVVGVILVSYILWRWRQIAVAAQLAPLALVGDPLAQRAALLQQRNIRLVPYAPLEVPLPQATSRAFLFGAAAPELLVV
jgi:hypothetical protein